MDERHNLPSASSAEADTLCLGRHNLISALRSCGIIASETASADADAGNRIHAAIAGEEAELTTEDERSVEVITEQINAVAQAVGVPADAKQITEERLWLRDGLRKIASGKPDAVFLWHVADGCAALIVDAKSGWREVTHEAGNLQLRRYAVLFWIATGRELKRVFVAIAHAHGQRPHPVCYESGDLAAAETEWREHLAAMAKPSARRTPGEKQCRYCTAVAHCPEARAYLPQNATEIAEQAALLSNGALAQYLDRLPLIKKLCSALETEAKARIKDDNTEGLDYTLKPGVEREDITDKLTVANRCGALGITAEALLEDCKLTKKALKDRVKGVTGLKGKALDAKLAEVLDGCTVSKTAAPQLVKIGAQLEEVAA